MACAHTAEWRENWKGVCRRQKRKRRKRPAQLLETVWNLCWCNFASCVNGFWQRFYVKKTMFTMESVRLRLWNMQKVPITKFQLSKGCLGRCRVYYPWCTLKNCMECHIFIPQYNYDLYMYAAQGATPRIPGYFIWDKTLAAGKLRWIFPSSLRN